MTLSSSMELLSIGVGHYAQRDVLEAAHAFTGWSIDDHDRRVFDPTSHDAGVKTILGQSGYFSYANVASILANHPACGRFLARKLWTFFAYEHPQDTVIDELAHVYRENRRSIRAVVRHVFGMMAFGVTDRVAVRVKSPVEYAVTAVRESDRSSASIPSVALSTVWPSARRPLLKKSTTPGSSSATKISICALIAEDSSPWFRATIMDACMWHGAQSGTLPEE